MGLNVKNSLNFSQEEFEENDIGDYRHRFPDETKGLTDLQLFNAVMATDDDMEDDEWRTLLKNTPR